MKLELACGGPIRRSTSGELLSPSKAHWADRKLLSARWSSVSSTASHGLEMARGGKRDRPLGVGSGGAVG